MCRRMRGPLAVRPRVLRLATVADKHAALKHSKALRRGNLVGDLTRAQRDARAKLHPHLLSLREQHLQPRFRGERFYFINAAQQR